MAAPVPKFPYVRDERLKFMCRGMVCQHCGATGPGVTWAHSNQSKHGKGLGEKASDVYVAALCTPCHAWLDQGRGSQEQNVAMWTAAWVKTIETALGFGTWPRGLAVPAEFHHYRAMHGLTEEVSA